MLQDEAARSSVKTPAGGLQSLQSADDASTSTSNRPFAADASAMSSEYAVS